MKFAILLISLIFTFMYVSKAAGEELILVSEKTAHAVIYCSPESSLVAKFAAGELQKHLKLCSSVEIPVVESLDGSEAVVIYVGFSPLAEKNGITSGIRPLTDEEFIIKSGPGQLLLAGDDGDGLPYVLPAADDRTPTRLGTLYAVYRFLEDTCGIRWYMPGELGTVIPAKTEIKVPELMVRSKPYFRHRRIDLFRNWYKTSKPWIDGDKNEPWLARTGYGSADGVYINHSFYYLNKYRKSNPEYFALLGGERDFRTTCYGKGNLCLSNPDTVEAFTKVVQTAFGRNPKLKVFPIMPNDCMFKICECPECQKWLPADMAGIDIKEISAEKKSTVFSAYVWNFVNKVARNIRKTHPDKLVGCCAYQTYLMPPDSEAPFEPNVAVMICKTRANFADPEYRSRIRDTIRKWHKITPNIYTWEYYIWNWRSWKDMPELAGFPVAFPHIIAEDLKFMKQYSLGGRIEAEEALGNPGLNHLNIYVTGKMLFNPDLDVDILLKEYYHLFYGPASREMQRFWNKAEQCWLRGVKNRDKGGDLQKTMSALYSTKDLAEFFALLKRAKTKTAIGSQEYKRIQLIEREMAPAKSFLEGKTALPKLVSASLDKSPVIDGGWDSSWQNAPVIKFVDKNGTPATPPTYMKVAHDSQNIYLAFKACESVKRKLVAKATKRNPSNIWKDDCWEIFLQPDPDTEGIVQLIINSEGVLWDAYHNNNNTFRHPTTWQSKAKLRVYKHDQTWNAEIAIKWQALGIRPRPGMKLKANFFRNRALPDNPEVSSWSSPGVFSRHATLQRFGEISFPE